MTIKFNKTLKSKIKRIKLSPKRIEKNQNQTCAAKKIKKIYKRTSPIKTTSRGKRISVNQGINFRIIRKEFQSLICNFA